MKYGERPLTPGKTINRQYLIKKVLGKGSYGITYLTKDLHDQKYAVVKQLRAYKARSGKGMHSFLREAKIQSSLCYAAFPDFYESFQWEKKHFISMEYVEGKTFEDLIFIQKESFGEKESFHILLKVLKAVKILHDNGIVHRDLRIPNIIMKNNQSIHIIDFGLARRLSDSKEVCKSETKYSGEKMLFREVSYQSDFFALGHFVLFLLYSGYVPSSGKNRSWEDELILSALGKEIIKRMLKLLKPYDSIDELMEEVLKCADGREQNVIF
ncbi:serine/threonine protein kinase [Metabacillus idriensis]|uniref:serine/threonine protein kinase n=1 Tax=Metabacillus idriensis TaxID=324768 RepID=UPI003D2735F0